MNMDNLTPEELKTWLARALSGHETPPRVAPDEYPHLAILRLEKSLKQPLRESLRDACLALVREFCAAAQGEPEYLQELLALLAALNLPQGANMLAQLARRLPELPRLSLEIRLKILATLVDMSPPQPSEFWYEILEQDKVNYSGLALSGVLATNPTEAIDMLPLMPDSVRAGQSAALKLDLVWDDLPRRRRFAFAGHVRAKLPICGTRFSEPLNAWLTSKGLPIQQVEAKPICNESLEAAIYEALGMECEPAVCCARL